MEMKTEDREIKNIIINRHLLWTLPNPEKAMSEWKRVLKTGGKVIIIDGSWGDYSRLHKQVWRHLVSMPLILITERRNPWRGHYGRDIEEQLPMRHRKRPHADIELFENLGFNADVRDVAVPRTRTFLEYMKYGHWSKQFLVKGVKVK